MPYFYKNKFNNSNSKSVLGGSVMKTQEEKDKLSNVSVLKHLPTQPKNKPVETSKPGVVNKVVNKHISDEKLKRFINFSI